MRILNLKNNPQPDADFSYIDVNASHYDELITENCKAVYPNGDVAFIFLKNVIPKEAVLSAWKGLKNYTPLVDNGQRGLASGFKKQYKYVDGKRTNLKAKRDYISTGTTGYFDRYPTFPACRPCAWNSANPEKWKMTLPLSQAVAKIHKQYDPKSFEIYDELIKKTSKDFIIEGTPYTTMTVNKNFRTFPHKDGRNFPVTCPMTIIRSGKYRGSNLVFLEHRVAVHVDTYDLILFMNAEEWHGNTRLTLLEKDAQRCSIIWYYRKGMLECGTMEQELDRVRNIGMGFKGLDDEDSNS